MLVTALPTVSKYEIVMADLREDTVEVKPSIIMKVDAPPEDNNLITSQVSASSSVVENDSVRTSVKPKKSVLASPRSNNSNPFAMRSSIVCSPKLNAGVLLRPSQLGSKVENKPDVAKNPFSLNPSRLKSFGKTDGKTGNKDETEELPSSSTSTTNNCSKENKNENNKLPVIAESMESITSTTSSSNNGTTPTETPKFVPLAPETRGSTSTVSTTTSTPNFVFGQNLHERVMSESENEMSSEPVASTSCTNANGTSELLFSSAVKKTVSASEQNKEVKTLTESAREYEESRANKRKYEEVTVVTGEEDEKNVLQLNCKLFAFDKATGNWQERGRGTLRLNDKEVSLVDSISFTQSRLVIRVTGSLRVVLNTKIWAEMTLDRASPKSLRLTAMDGSGQIKVFLIMANPDEINQLHRLLDARVHSEIERQKQLKNVADEPEAKKRATETSDQ